MLLSSRQVNYKTPDMNKRAWLVPILIVAINALAIIVQWSSLPELLPAHFDLQGNAGGTMPRSALPFFPLASAAICLIAYAVARIKQSLQTGLAMLASGIGLVVFLSTLVTLTAGTMPILMLAEPVVLLIAVVGFVASVVKSRKDRR